MIKSLTITILFIFVCSFANEVVAQHKKVPTNGVAIPYSVSTIASRIDVISPKLERGNGVSAQPSSINSLNIAKNIEVSDNTPSLDITDNHIAVSNIYEPEDTIVSVKNSRIVYHKTDGTSLGSVTLSNFIANPHPLFTAVDPRIRYDTDYNRFIISFFEVNNQFTKGYLHVLVSQTSNPLGNWWGLMVEDSVLSHSDTINIDRPELGLSRKEVYITLQVRSDYGQSFLKTAIVAIPKSTFYNGQPTLIDNVIVDDVNADDPYGLYPISWGQEGNYGPGAYFISINNPSGDYLHLYDLTNYIFTGNYSIVKTDIPINHYENPAPLPQLGTSYQLSTDACRVFDGYYLNGMIHYVYTKSDLPNVLSEISYNRYDVANNSNTEKTYSNPDYGCAYPAICSFGKDTLSKSSLIPFVVSGDSIHPSFRVIACDDNMDWSNDLLVKAGETIMFGPQWCDYIGAARKHNLFTETGWIVGNYPVAIVQGQDTSFKVYSYIAEIFKGTANSIYQGLNSEIGFKVYPNPITHKKISVSFVMSQNKEIDISLFSVEGKKIKTLYVGSVENMPTNYEFQNMSSGNYFIVLQHQQQIIAYEKLIFN